MVCMSSPKLTLKFSSSGEVVRGVGMAVVEVGPSGMEVKFSHNSAGCQFPRGGDPRASTSGLNFSRHKQWRGCADSSISKGVFY